MLSFFLRLASLVAGCLWWLSHSSCVSLELVDASRWFFFLFFFLVEVGQVQDSRQQLGACWVVVLGVQYWWFLCRQWARWFEGVVG
jgi:hypothetical protein